MSDVSQGPGWWQASDGKWYRPEQHPSYWSSPPPTMGQTAVAPFPGVPQYYYPPGGARPTNGLAIASLVLSIIWLAGLGSLLAITFGIVARRQIRSSAGRQGGDGVALAGLVIGIVGLVAVMLTWGLFFAVKSTVENATNAQVASCRADAKSLETALEAYRAQNGSYPPLLAPWSGASYEVNYALLTTANSHGGPWLRAAPATSNYVIEYDSNGQVWVNGIGDYSGYSSSNDFNSNPDACNVAFP